MANSLAQLAEGDPSLDHSLRLLEVKLNDRLLKVPADEAQHLTQEDVEGAIACIDTLKSIQILFNLNQGEDFFGPCMRPDTNESEFIPWLSPLIPSLQEICLLVEDGLSTGSVLDQILKEWCSIPRTFKEADGDLTTMWIGKLDLEHALQELERIHRQNKAHLLAQSPSRSPKPELRRGRSMASSPRISRPASIGDALNASQQEEGIYDIIADGWDDETTIADSAAPGHVSQGEVTGDGLQDKTSPLVQQRPHYSVPSHTSDHGSEMSEYDPYRLINPDFGKEMEQPRSLLRQVNESIIASSSEASENERYGLMGASKKAKRSVEGPTSVHGRRPHTPIQDSPNGIESLHPTPQWIRNREAIRVQRSNAPVDVQSIRSRHSTQQVRDRSSNNRRLSREVPGAPASLGKANQPRSLAGEFEGLVVGQLLQQRPVRLAAGPAALPAPPGKAKSRKESRYTSRHTPMVSLAKI
ncbi:hypothetical protein HBI95_080550 [Parastagonospora nodorum]|nr:hypothetical protein HBI09_167400 [Parastagonospora nodorum]KAH4093370.1 hypothetical protein HBH46_179290 [Parastagonospora nodorum]KAH4209769.1 hypothetical protein HBI95_080550 [Parastagonospora nodorum]KAH5004016.1 hypothetical protein HBI77_127890 [Parastagonospora nodorum]KAH5641777.1 hypothetical protein HBI51_131900 [Parastagonospora nodorum]